MPIGWHRNPEESIHYDEPRWCKHGLNIEQSDCGQCIQQQAESDAQDRELDAAETSRQIQKFISTLAKLKGWT